MSGEVVIRTEALGKRYKLGALEPYRTLRDAIAGAFRRAPQESAHPAYHWALRNIQLEVTRGEVLGIVGPNGSGKSTLLKLLTRITRPTEGRIVVRGRIGALLEVGTGFHPELTGRENIYLNGSILGMSRADTTHRLDEIVDFAGVEEYLDTPVKRYSSGMAVRLAFAVAAHLEPEILVVDEVLAVGDATFQEKCLGRMGNIAAEGRTILFVSHQMESILSLCERAMWLDDGGKLAEGDSTDIVHRYLSASREKKTDSLRDRLDRKGTGIAKVHEIQLLDENKSLVSRIVTGQPCSIVCNFESTNGHEGSGETYMNLAIRDGWDRVVTFISTRHTGLRMSRFPSRGSIVIRIPRMPLVPGRYNIDFSLRIGGVVSDKVFRAFGFEILPGLFYGESIAPATGNGLFFMDYDSFLE